MSHRSFSSAQDCTSAHPHTLLGKRGCGVGCHVLGCAGGVQSNESKAHQRFSQDLDNQGCAGCAEGVLHRVIFRGVCA